MNTTWTKLICAAGVLAGAAAGIVACEVTVTDVDTDASTIFDSSTSDSGNGDAGGDAGASCDQTNVDDRFVPLSACQASKCCAEFTKCHAKIPNGTSQDDTCIGLSLAVQECLKTDAGAGGDAGGAVSQCIKDLKDSYKTDDAGVQILATWETMNECLLSKCSN